MIMSRQLGIKWKVEPEQIIMGLPQEPPASAEVASKNTVTWDHHFEQLKEYHAQSGHFMVPYRITGGKKRPRDSDDPDEETLRLGGWVKRQRMKYASDTLSSDRVDKLKSIGFKFNVGVKSKRERLDVQLGLLDSLRKRTELSVAQVADLDFLYDEWKRRAETNSTKPLFANVAPGSLSADNTHVTKWRNTFKKLKEFKLQHGHMRIPRDQGKELKALNKWVANQRDQYSKRNKGVKVGLDDDRIGEIALFGVAQCTTNAHSSLSWFFVLPIAQLESIGFSWTLREDVALLISSSIKRAPPKVPDPGALKSLV
jgi:hypothetical protein